jgi:hypothetical protein
MEQMFGLYPKIVIETISDHILPWVDTDLYANFENKGVNMKIRIEHKIGNISNETQFNGGR